MIHTSTAIAANARESAQERVAQPRPVERLVAGMATSDGAGVRLTRVLTQHLQRRLDPFLMLDAFKSDDPDDYLAGFPDHPHRGFETVTYMLAGRMRHRDSAGHEGLLENGGVQWMTAGSGLIHSELPEQEDGLMEGFQLWINLAAKDKMTTPGYRDIPSDKIPELTTDAGATVRVIAGQSHGVAGAVTRPLTEPLYLDVHLPQGASFAQAIPEGHNAFLYVYRGAITLGCEVTTPVEVPTQRMAVLANAPGADGVVFTASGGPARVLVLAGAPLNEPIAQYGPFVMNRQDELHQAMQDYRDGKFDGGYQSAG